MRGSQVDSLNAKGNRVTKTTYDPLERPIAEENALGDSNSTIYDAIGNVRKMTDRNGEVVTYQYDGLNRPTLITYVDDGETIEYKYGLSIYHLVIDSDSTLHWEAMTGDEKGHGGEEKYISDQLPNGEIFITWGDENGTGVSQVLDFTNSKVYNHLSWDRKVATGAGVIRVIE